MGSSPEWGCAVIVWSLLGILSLPLTFPLLMLSLSNCKTNKKKKKKDVGTPKEDQNYVSKACECGVRWVMIQTLLSSRYRSVFTHRRITSCFQERKQRHPSCPLTPAVFQVPLAQNNPCREVAFEDGTSGCPSVTGVGQWGISFHRMKGTRQGS